MRPNAVETDYLSPFLARLFRPYSVLGLLLLITTARFGYCRLAPWGRGWMKPNIGYGDRI